jgi:hypothetical protein
MSDELPKTADEFRREAMNSIKEAEEQIAEARRAIDQGMPQAAMAALWVSGISVETARQCMRAVSASQNEYLRKYRQKAGGAPTLTVVVRGVELPRLQ